MLNKNVNMKTGILTFHNANNYGAVLQAYALQEAVKKICPEVSIIDYRCRAIEMRYFPPNLHEGSLKHRLRRCVEYGFQKIKYKKFDIFRKNFFNLDKKELLDNDYYDIIIVGSDQVWNYKLTDCDWTFFLKPVRNSVQKCAYAPSFGLSNIEPILEEEIASCLNNFKQLSVREETGRTLISRLTGKDVPVVVDPTLLLSKTEWITKMQIKKKREEYILVYLFGVIKEATDYIHWLSEKTKLPIIVIDSSLKKVIKGKYVRFASPKKWVELFANAKYVVTNSFHGLMFSIIFEKEFYIAPLQKEVKTGSRIDDSLERLGLENRKINGFMIKEDIDYEKVHERLEEMISHSMTYLLNSMEEI